MNPYSKAPQSPLHAEPNFECSHVWSFQSERLILAAEGGGGAQIFLHGFTREQGFRTEPNRTEHLEGLEGWEGTVWKGKRLPI